MALGADMAISGRPPDSTVLRISTAPIPEKGICLAIISFSMTPKAYTSTFRTTFGIVKCVRPRRVFE